MRSCKTRGQDGFAVLLSCRALSSPTTCRFIPAHSELADDPSRIVRLTSKALVQHIIAHGWPSPLARNSGRMRLSVALGAGGMGEVYRARDTRLERDVAVKVLPTNLSSDPCLQQRLEREAKALSKLSHPHICTLHDIGHQDGVDFLVMELVEGETLERRLIKGPLPPEQTLRFAAQIADALAKAHKMGITHRDLKPSNVMLTKPGAKLMDFGLAKAVRYGSLGRRSDRDDGRPSEVDGRRHDRRDVPVHGARAVGRERSGCAHRYFRAR